MATDLKHLSYLESLGEWAANQAMSAYGATKTRLPGAIAGRLTGIESYVQPYIEKLSNTAPALLSTADGQVDYVYTKGKGAVTYGSELLQRIEGEMLARITSPERAKGLQEQRQEYLARAYATLSNISIEDVRKAVYQDIQSTAGALEARATAVRAAGEQYLAQVSEAAKALRTQGIPSLTGAAMERLRAASDAVLAAVEEARKGDYARTLIVKVQGALHSLLSMPSVSLAVKEIGPRLESAVDLATAQYAKAHHALVTHPLYAQAVHRAWGATEQVQRSSTFQGFLAVATTAADRVYPTIEPIVGPYQDSIRAMVTKAVDHFRPAEQAQQPVATGGAAGNQASRREQGGSRAPAQHAPPLS